MDLDISGKTLDGKFVVQGLWNIHSTHGVPIEELLETCIAPSKVTNP